MYKKEGKELKNSPKAPSIGGEFFDFVKKLLDTLPSRSQEILSQRYGLDGKEGETLEEIGKKHGITRERVRQIITDAIKKISAKKEDESFRKFEEKIISNIKENYGIIDKNEVLEKLSGKDAKERNSIMFFADCTSKIIAFEDAKTKESWIVSEEVIKEVEKVEKAALEILGAERRIMEKPELAEKISQKINFPAQQVFSYLKVLKEIEKNKFEKWGMAEWSEITPKGTRDRVYLVLKQEKKPMHFTEIADLIDKYHLSKKKSHPQTIHNELIKDNRFVLIGRGIYALKEWGYPSGTVKDILQEILRKNRRAMTREEILNAVLKVRRVKKSTIMINLNSREFVRQNNFYSIKKQ